ncbi:hypothetical protein FH972_023579 [Carpinus fangiana]|uniref:2-oxoglutarate reductase n=1 Tax=Carpinus fangiana TaxID=176857 RepID=A0A5N6KVK7_9ROSI|nr:hypothetical protein FH972_023579 [Carpinus fangiana]
MLRGFSHGNLEDISPDLGLDVPSGQMRRSLPRADLSRIVRHDHIVQEVIVKNTMALSVPQSLLHGSSRSRSPSLCLPRGLPNSADLGEALEPGPRAEPRVVMSSQGRSLQRSTTHSSAAAARELKPFATADIKILLLENVNTAGQDILRQQGYQVEALKSSLPEAELIEKIQDVHVIGIRSKTQLTKKVIDSAPNLLVIGCFCIGTNQVDLKHAAQKGVAVFNSPFSNSRSVAEQVISEIIALARQICDRSMELHQGKWNKVSAGCWEVRGKTLGIVGYGHIGNQLSVLAEAMGMRVIFYDVVNLMSMGTAHQVSTLDELLQQADFVTLHVPELPETENMISTEQLNKMKDGSYLLNLSRGSIVDIQAVIDASRSGKLAGAAFDVYPNEPAANGDYFNNSLNQWTDALNSCKNFILTPHIGGSTEEAQRAIGVEVADALVQYVNYGTTLGACNMPEVNLRSLTADEPNHVRMVYIHQNVPGVLRRVNEILGDHNVDKQMTDSRGDVAYLMADISNVNQQQIKDIYVALEELSSRIRTRVLY